MHDDYSITHLHDIVFIKRVASRRTVKSARWFGPEEKSAKSAICRDRDVVVSPLPSAIPSNSVFGSNFGDAKQKCLKGPSQSQSRVPANLLPADSLGITIGIALAVKPNRLTVVIQENLRRGRIPIIVSGTCNNWLTSHSVRSHDRPQKRAIFQFEIWAENSS